jgi:sortase A
MTTAFADLPSGDDLEVIEDDPIVGGRGPDEPSDAAPARRMSIAKLVAVWALLALVVLVLVLYVLEPLFQQNTQNRLMGEYSGSIEQAVNETNSIHGVTVPTKPPSTGSPVGILDIAGIRLQQVVVEGVAPSQTQDGPGHVPGTAAPGQPGNSAVVCRRAMFGGPCERLDQLQGEDMILVSTVQGQVVYKVESVEQVKVVPSPEGASGSAKAGSDDSTSTPPTTSVPVGGTGGDVVSVTGPRLTTFDELYAPSDDDRLTMVTSASAWPSNSSLATVVTAKLQGSPYEPTPQAGRSDNQNGNSGQSGSWPAVLLAVQAFVLSAGAAVYFYRRSSAAVAYVLTTPPLIVFAIIAAEQVGRMFPAWS